MRRRAGGLLLLLMMASSASAEVAFPHVDAEAYCQMIMESNPAATLDPALLASCVSTDLQDREEAVRRWDEATQDIREQCKEIAQLNNQRSYGLILGCIRLLEQRV